MKGILNFDSLADYNEFYGLPNHNPLISVYDLSILKNVKHVVANYGFYAVFLKEGICGNLIYGHNKYDYDEGTLIFVAPGQVYGTNDGGMTVQPKGYALIFHPDLLHGTSLEKRIKNYSFFSYSVHEALHTSEKERETLMTCFHGIEDELNGPIDRHTKLIIASNIEVLLNNCMRYYDRQFITREPINKGVLEKFEGLLHHYYDNENASNIGMPSVQYFADKLHLSSNYFGDLIKKSTGKSPLEHIQFEVTERIKDNLTDSDKTVNEIAYELGFNYPHHLSRMFKKVVGCSPVEYRRKYS